MKLYHFLLGFVLVHGLAVFVLRDLDTWKHFEVAYICLAVLPVVAGLVLLGIQGLFRVFSWASIPVAALVLTCSSCWGGILDVVFRLWGC